MADKTLDSDYLILRDNWPGVPIPYYGLPNSDFANTTDHNVAAATYNVGDKICVYNTGVTAGKAGWATFIYLQYEGTGAPTLAAKQVVVPDADTSAYVVTNDPDSALIVTGSYLAAVAISVMTDAYYGFFWCGGVCPEEFVAGLGGNYNTESNVAIGPVVAHDLTADEIGFGPVGADTEAIIGFALHADAA